MTGVQTCALPIFCKTVLSVPKWHLLTVEERSQFITKAQGAQVQPHSAAMTDIDFDIRPENTGLNLSLDLLKAIFAKAERLVKEKQILPAPCHINAVASYSCLSDQKGHYTTTILNTGEVKCSCRAYHAHHICSHTVASAHLHGSLFKLVRFHRGKFNKKPLNMNVFTRSVDTQRAGLKDNERRRVRKPTSTETSVTDRPVVESCQHDDLLRVINLSDHNRVRVCYGCKSKIIQNNPDQTALASKIYRNYFDKKTKKTKFTLKREWAYFHVHCSKHIPDRGIDVHMCVGHTIPQTTLDKLKNTGFILS